MIKLFNFSHPLTDLAKSQIQDIFGYQIELIEQAIIKARQARFERNKR